MGNVNEARPLRPVEKVFMLSRYGVRPQAMGQIRLLAPLTGPNADGPFVAAVPVPGCAATAGMETLCTLAGFEAFSNDRIDRDATTIPDYRP